MKFLWKPTREAVSPTSVGTIAATDEGETRNCRSLSQVLERLFRQHERPSILDIGPFCGPSAIFLADLGARVTVEELDLDQPGLQAPSEENPNPPDVQIGTDGKFDLILAWECPDFVHPSRLAALGRALEQRVADDGWVLILAQNQGVGGAGNHTSTQSLPRYKILAEDRLQSTPTAESRTRYAHPARSMEQWLEPIKVNGIQLQRDQMREFLFHRS